jgi:hypothetical protein
MGSMSTNNFCWLEKCLKEPLQWTMRGSTRSNVTIEGNFKICEKIINSEDLVIDWIIYLNKVLE